MKTVSSNVLRIVAAALFLLVVVVGYWAFAKKEISSVARPCQPGSLGCAAALDASLPAFAAASSRPHRIICAPEDQNCDTRTQDARTNAYRELRDRHSERD